MSDAASAAPGQSGGSRPTTPGVASVSAASSDGLGNASRVAGQEHTSNISNDQLQTLFQLEDPKEQLE